MLLELTAQQSNCGIQIAKWQMDVQEVRLTTQFFQEISHLEYTFVPDKLEFGRQPRTLDSGINIGVRLLIFEKFWRQKKFKNDRNA